MFNINYFGSEYFASLYFQQDLSTVLPAFDGQLYPTKLDRYRSPRNVVDIRPNLTTDRVKKKVVD